MIEPNFLILYVENLTISAEFYTQLLGKKPQEASPNFVMFALASGVMLGLWAKKTVEPDVTVSAGSGELAFAVARRIEVEHLYAQWSLQQPIIQAPINLDFGYTFVVLDPDGHRLRVFTPTEPDHVA